MVILGYGRVNFLSPLLFSLFLNDLTAFTAHAYNGLEDISSMS